ncbi:hypothetical protein GUJ93_ZPchr0008g12776 [Zizania palustris]|uniref:LOB domain-containing protein n=1 Tax=Zizania palustris TaxID=103762 RepID=A0A8J5VF37_ZIZPA|nr:hypothetical protein GUJ93_ZPchr0008g12776 [Zizania palustris]
MVRGYIRPKIRPNPAKISRDLDDDMMQQQQHDDDGEYGGGGGRDDEDALHLGAGRCAACRYLRRRCTHDCVLAPFFPASRPHRYACVHRVFGASNVARLLESLPMAERSEAANTMAREAYWRVQDPVYGVTGIISRLQDEIRAVQLELARTQAQITIVAGSGSGVTQRAPPPQQPPPPPPLPTPQLARAGGHPTLAVRRQEQDEELTPTPPPPDPTDEFLNLDKI